MPEQRFQFFPQVLHVCRLKKKKLKMAKQQHGLIEMWEVGPRKGKPDIFYVVYKCALHITAIKLSLHLQFKSLAMCLWAAKITCVNTCSVCSRIFASFDQHLELHFLELGRFSGE